MVSVPLAQAADPVGASARSSGTSSLECPAQPEGVPSGAYATSYQKNITLSKGANTVELGPGEAAYSDGSAVSCLQNTPEFLRQDPTPWPADLGQGRGCGLYLDRRPLSGSEDSLNPIDTDYLDFDRRMLSELESFLKAGYPAPSVIYHAVSLGMSVDYALYLATKGVPERAQELYQAAAGMVPYLPGWACGTGSTSGLYSPVYELSDLPDERSVREVAKRFFKDRARLAPFPDWPQKDFHMMASITELLELVDEHFWYQVGPPSDTPGGHPRESVMVSLYPDPKQIVVDATKEKLLQLQQEGKDRVAVTFMYNRKYHRPASRFDEDVTLERVIDSFFSDAVELTPVPMWQVGDHHLVVKTKELVKLFEILEKDEIPPARYSQVIKKLQEDGFSKQPVMVTLLRGNGKWLDRPERVRAAMELGMEQVPVTIFYHRVNRQACGAPATCYERLCAAAVCAGADPEVCKVERPGVRPGPLPFGGGGGGVSPPSPPPATPRASPS